MTSIKHHPNVRVMIKKSHSLASAVSDSCKYNLHHLTVYKAEKRGVRVILFVNPVRTSQKCSWCGDIVQKLPFQRDRLWSRCGLIIDRDVNAARKILASGLDRPLKDAEPLLIQRRIDKFGRGSEKLTSFRRGYFNTAKSGADKSQIGSG